MVQYFVRTTVPVSRMMEALLEDKPAWGIPWIPWGVPERVSETEVRLHLGGGVAAFTVHADGPEGCRVVVGHSPKETLFPGRTPENSWRQVWGFLVARLKSHVEGVPLLPVPPPGGPNDAPVELSAHYPVPPERLWAALTDPTEMDQWVADGARVELRQGGAYDYGWTDRGPTTLLSMDPGRMLEMDWRFNTAESEGRVVWTVGPEAGGARLTLVHHGFSSRKTQTGPRDGFVWGWADFLQSLRLYLQGAGPSESWRGLVAEKWDEGV